MRNKTLSYNTTINPKKQITPPKRAIGKIHRNETSNLNEFKDTYLQSITKFAKIKLDSSDYHTFKELIQILERLCHVKKKIREGGGEGLKGQQLKRDLKHVKQERQSLFVEALEIRQRMKKQRKGELQNNQKSDMGIEDVLKKKEEVLSQLFRQIECMAMLAGMNRQNLPLRQMICFICTQLEESKKTQQRNSDLVQQLLLLQSNLKLSQKSSKNQSKLQSSFSNLQKQNSQLQENHQKLSQSYQNIQAERNLINKKYTKLEQQFEQLVRQKLEIQTDLSKIEKQYIKQLNMWRDKKEGVEEKVSIVREQVEGLKDYGNHVAAVIRGTEKWMEEHRNEVEKNIQRFFCHKNQQNQKQNSNLNLLSKNVHHIILPTPTQKKILTYHSSLLNEKYKPLQKTITNTFSNTEIIDKESQNIQTQQKIIIDVEVGVDIVEMCEIGVECFGEMVEVEQFERKIELSQENIQYSEYGINTSLPSFDHTQTNTSQPTLSFQPQVISLSEIFSTIKQNKQTQTSSPEQSQTNCSQQLQQTSQQLWIQAQQILEIPEITLLKRELEICQEKLERYRVLEFQKYQEKDGQWEQRQPHQKQVFQLENEDSNIFQLQL